MDAGDHIYQDHRRYGVVLVVDGGRVLVSWRPIPKAAEWFEIEPLPSEGIVLDDGSEQQHPY
jgi:hypothetical protein